MRIVLACLVVAVGLAAGPRTANAYMAIGAGLSSCGAWTADRRNPSGVAALEDSQWVVGFLSGMGFVHANDDDPLVGVDAEAVLAWIDNYCRAKPLEKIEHATIQFYQTHPR
jgi:hypothetical protein